jgi:hypothetical protein
VREKWEGRIMLEGKGIIGGMDKIAICWYK